MKPEDPSGGRLPLRATAIVLGFWVIALLVVTFVGVPLLFSVCGAIAGSP